MPDRYYQEYGPIRRRRATGDLAPDDPPPAVAALPEVEPTPLTRSRRASREESRQRRRRRRAPLGLLLLVLIGVAGFLALPYAMNLFAGDRAIDGVSLQGRSIAGMRRDEIRAMLEQRYGPFLQTPLTISFENRTWTPTLDQLGVS